ncbi:hypothetical protein V6Z11_D01G034200 [Gossypium hirsutum]
MPCAERNSISHTVLHDMSIMEHRQWFSWLACTGFNTDIPYLEYYFPKAGWMSLSE